MKIKNTELEKIKNQVTKIAANCFLDALVQTCINVKKELNTKEVIIDATQPQQ
jgi:hypothetical protein